MATLTTNQLRKCRQALHQAYSALAFPIGWTKTEIDNELDNIDSWQDLNQTLIAQQYSAGFRAKASAADLALIFIVIAIARRLIGNPSHISILRQILDSINGIDGV
jgi:hypothetical protein